MTSFGEVPNMSALREEKPGYDSRFGDIDVDHPLHSDPLVDPREYGFEARSYYARPNRMTGEPLPGVPDAPLLRLDVVGRLRRADRFLRTDPDVREALGAPACLRIDDALRPEQVQHFIFDVAWPSIVRRQNPGLSDDEVAAEVLKYCAEPKTSKTATPHLTGGGVDVALVNLETGKGFDRGHKAGGVKGTAYPDFHEGYHLTPGSSDIVNSPEQSAVASSDSKIVAYRRILYYATTVVAGMYMNPHEIWHVGIGDPLSSYLGGGPAYYGIAELPEWYVRQMEEFQA